MQAGHAARTHHGDGKSAAVETLCRRNVARNATQKGQRTPRTAHAPGDVDWQTARTAEPTAYRRDADAPFRTPGAAQIRAPCSGR
jgi:hypothetical protein